MPMPEILNPNTASQSLLWVILAIIGGGGATGILPISGANAEDVKDIKANVTKNRIELSAAQKSLQDSIEAQQKAQEAMFEMLQKMQRQQIQQTTEYYDSEIMTLDLRANKTENDRVIIENLKRKREAHLKSF